MRENSSKPVWADDDWLSTFAGKQALEHQRQDQGLPKEISESQSTETEVATTKAKRPAEMDATEGMVKHNNFDYTRLLIHVTDDPSNLQ